MLLALALAASFAGQAPVDNDFLRDDGRVAALARELEQARAALALERKARIAAEVRADAAEAVAKGARPTPQAATAAPARVDVEVRRADATPVSLTYDWASGKFRLVSPR